MRHFTNYWYRTPSDGKIQPAPAVPPGFVAVPYEDQGYHGGEYWAILPMGWTIKQAADIYEGECSNTLVSVNGKIV